MSTVTIYPTFKNILNTGSINILTDTIKVMLVKDTYVFSPSHQYVSDVTGGATNFEYNSNASGSNYQAGFSGTGRQTLASKTLAPVGINNYRFDANDVSWTNLTQASHKQIGGAIIYKHLTNDSSSQLIALVGLNSTVTPDGSTLTIKWSQNGIYTTSNNLPNYIYSAADYLSIQDAIDAMVAANVGGTIYIPTGIYTITTPLDFHGFTLPFSVIGDGIGSIIQSDYPVGSSDPSRKWPILDMTGAAYDNVRDISVQCPSDEGSCGCGIFVARLIGESSGFKNITNVTVSGFFNGACLWNDASEVDIYDSCTFINYKKVTDFKTGGWCAFFGNGKTSGADPDTLPLPYSLIKRASGDYGGSTMEQTNIYNCKFIQSGIDKGGSAVNVMVYSNSGAIVSDLHFSGGGCEADGDPTNASISSLASFCYWLDNTNPGGQMQETTIQHMRCATLAKYFLYVYTPAEGRSLGFFVIRDNWIECLETPFKISTITTDGPIIIEGNTILTKAQYTWGNAGIRALWDSTRDSSITWKNNITNLNVADNTKANKIYKCAQISQLAYIQAQESEVAMSTTNVGAIIDEYYRGAGNENGTTGLRRVNLGYLATANYQIVPNLYMFTGAPPDPEVGAYYKDGDLVLANVGGSYRIYVKAGSWRYLVLT